MKRKFVKAFGVIALLGVMSFQGSVYASGHHHHHCGEYTGTYSALPRADVKYWVHKTQNGIKMHRLWNETQNKYEGSWVICNC